MAIENSTKTTAKDKDKELVSLDYQVLESMVDWVRVVDTNDTIIYANKAMKDSLGESIVGMKCYNTHCRDKKCGFCISARSMQTGETMQKEEVINGVHYSIKSSPVYDGDGNIRAAVEVFRDVTRERKLERELIERNKKMNKDLKFAKKIQEKILPKRGNFENVRIDYLYKPSDMLSGDMFDVFIIDRDNLGIYISDVAGHGIAASIMTMFIRQTMRAIKDDVLSPSLALSELHRRFSMLGLESDKYFTIFYGVYNRRTKQFKFANAGHNCFPIKFNNKDIEILEMKGFPIALLFDELTFKEKRIELVKGDKIILYTDGITEAKDHNNKEFGVKGVIDTIKNSPDDILKQIENRFIYHSWGEQDDDYALLLMEVIN